MAARASKSVLGSLCAIALCAGCVPAVSTVGPQHVHNNDVARLHGPYVAAGTSFVAVVNQPIDTQRSLQGQPFTAVVQTPLTSPDGRVIVPSGAILRGTVASVGNDSAPRIRVALESIDTIGGPAHIRAAIRNVQHHDYAGPLHVGDSPSAGLGGFDGYEWESGDAYTGSWGGGPTTQYGYGYYSPIEVHVPRGAQMRLVLTRPLALPDAR